MSLHPSPNSDRAKALRHLEAKLGAEGVQWFLRTHQPDLGDQSGAELLQADPAKLLRKLRELEVAKSLEVIDSELDEDIVVDPYEPRLPRRAEKDVARVLALLDELQPERTTH